MADTIPHHSTHLSTLLNHLSAGVTQVEAARALGITESAVSQLLATPEAAAQLEVIQAEQLKRYDAIDKQYDRVEKKLLDRLEMSIGTMLRPMEISKVLAAVNGAKRRGSQLPTANQNGPAKIVQLNIPVSIQQKFILNAGNQVVQAGSQQLVTIQSGNVSKLAAEKLDPAKILDDPTKIEEANYVLPATTHTQEPSPSSSSKLYVQDEFGFEHEITAPNQSTSGS